MQMPVNLDEIKAIKSIDQLRKFVGHPIIKRKKFVGYRQELEFLGRFMAIAASEVSYAAQAADQFVDLSGAIRFGNAIRKWYAQGHRDNSEYQLEAFKVLSEGYYLEEAAGTLRDYEFGGIQLSKDPVVYFNSIFRSIERVQEHYKINILPQLKVALIYEEMDVYLPKFHYSI